MQKLGQHGYTLGKSLSFEARSARGQVNKLREIVRSMKADRVDVIVAGGFPTALACKTANVPTVSLPWSRRSSRDAPYRQPGASRWQHHWHF